MFDDEMTHDEFLIREVKEKMLYKVILLARDCENLEELELKLRCLLDDNSSKSV